MFTIAERNKTANTKSTTLVTNIRAKYKRHDPILFPKDDIIIEAITKNTNAEKDDCLD